MANKINNTKLLYIFLGLVAILLLARFFGGNKQQSIRTDLFSVDSASVSSIILETKAEKQEPMTLVKNGTIWEVKKGDATAEADEEAIKGMLSLVKDVKVKRLAARSKDKWASLEVNDSLGSHVKIMSGSEVVADFVVGKFSFSQNPANPQQPNIASFVRLTDEDEVYVVDGYMAMSFNQSFSGLRNKQMIKADANSINTLGFSYADGTTLELTKSESSWTMGETTADSASVQRYLNRISNLLHSTILDSFDPSTATELAKLQIAGNNMEPISLKCFQGSTPKEFIVNSSQNPDAYFTGDSASLYTKVFARQADFLPATE